MHVCVIGAGVVGLTTAYFLQSEGHTVSIVERESAAGLGASGGNGAQLSYAFVAPLADGTIPFKLPGLLFSRHAPLKLHPRADLVAAQMGASVPEGRQPARGAQHHRSPAEARRALARVHRAADRGRAHRMRLHARRQAGALSGCTLARSRAGADDVPGGARYPRPGGAHGGRSACEREPAIAGYVSQFVGRRVDADRSGGRLWRVLHADRRTARAARR